MKIIIIEDDDISFTRSDVIEEGEEAQIFAKGKEEGIKKIAINMLKENIAIDTILKCTGMTKEKLQSLATLNENNNQH